MGKLAIAENTFQSNDSIYIMSVSAPQSQVLNQLSNLSGYEFEQFVSDLWAKQGWRTEVTTGSNDRGIDVIATCKRPFNQKHLIQAKCYDTDNAVSSTEIQQYASLKHQESSVDAVVVVTTSYFSTQAKEIADDLNLKIIDGDRLYNIIDRNNHHSVLQDYIDISSKQSQSDKPTQSSQVCSENQRNQNDTSSSERPDIGLDVLKKGVGVERSNIMNGNCPICNEENVIWEIKHPDKDNQLMCNLCDTVWEINVDEITYEDHPGYSGILDYLRFSLNKPNKHVVKLKVIDGDKIGEEHTVTEWMRMIKGDK